MTLCLFLSHIWYNIYDNNNLGDRENYAYEIKKNDLPEEIQDQSEVDFSKL